MGTTRTLTTCLFATTALLLISQPVKADPRVYCWFYWNTNSSPEKNVRGGSIKKDVIAPIGKYNTMVQPRTQNVRVTGDRLNKCTINHPRNTLMDATFRKKKLQLNKNGRIPYCRDLNAKVTCQGAPFTEKSPSQLK